MPRALLKASRILAKAKKPSAQKETTSRIICKTDLLFAFGGGALLFEELFLAF